MGKNRLITGIGAALVDILAMQSDEFLREIDAQKGGMTLVDEKGMDLLIDRTTCEPVVVPGGSACNTVIGVARLGGSARFVGKLGEDDYGRFFESELKKSNVSPYLVKSSSATGRVLSLITPDAQRTLFTFLGASSEPIAEETIDNSFCDSAIVQIEGYLVFNEELIAAALNAAKKATALISFDLASYTVVEEFKPVLHDIVEQYVDILIANEDEARAFTGFSDEIKAVNALSEMADLAVLKVGARGSYIAKDGEIIKIEPFGSGGVIDTTGAGDLWAAGFLFGLVNGYPLDKCGKLGSVCGYEVCQVVGAHIPDEIWPGIIRIVEE